jgi:hypothetical protein
MNAPKLYLAVLLTVVLSSCSSKTEPPAATQPSNPTAPAVPAAVAADQPAAPSPTTTPQTSPPTLPKPEPEAVKPPEPKKYVVAAGTPISVRTTNSLSSKSVKTGDQFEATLENGISVEGHTVANRGATVTGTIVNADEGGRVKGKASLTLGLARLHLSNGQTVAIKTNSVVREAKSGTGKNLKRTGIATGAGAAIGAIAGGGRGAAIGAGVGAGAGVATNLATRGPAAEIPAETVLNFSLASQIVVVEKQ